MKKLWKRFKNWLIKKLGGYVNVPEKTFEIKHTLEPIVTLNLTSVLSMDHFLHTDNQKNLNENVIKDLITYKLADEIIERRLFNYTIKTNHYDMTREFKVQIKLAKPEFGGFR